MPSAPGRTRSGPVMSTSSQPHWRIRSQLLFTGRMPVTENLPETWYASPNAHLCTIKDFVDLVEVVNAELQTAVAFNSSGKPLAIRRSLSLQNLLGEKAVFLLTRKPGL